MSTAEVCVTSERYLDKWVSQGTRGDEGICEARNTVLTQGWPPSRALGSDAETMSRSSGWKREGRLGEC